MDAVDDREVLLGVEMSFNPPEEDDAQGGSHQMQHPSSSHRWRPEEYRKQMQQLHQEGDEGMLDDVASQGIEAEDAASISAKVLVVLLVAAGTVCVLTNALIVAVLIRQRGRLCLRYQIMLNQSLAGMASSVVIIYPLKILSSLLSDSSTHAGSSSWLSKSWLMSSSSPLGCLAVCSLPLVAASLLAAAHAGAMALETSLNRISVARYMVLISSKRLGFALISACWGIPIATAAFPIVKVILTRNKDSKAKEEEDLCHLLKIWPEYYGMSIMGSLGLFLIFALALVLSIKFCSGSRTFRTATKSKKKKRQYHPQTRSQTRVKGTKSSLLVIHPLHVPSSSTAASSLLSSSEVHDQTAVSLIQLVSVVFLLAPAIAHSLTSTADSAYDDAWLPWCWLSTSLALALIPVSHLLCDDVVSGLGLEAARDLFGALDGRPGFGGRNADYSVAGEENEAFLGTQT